MNLDELASGCGEWLRAEGPESDIVISSRIRLARNLAEFPFIRRCSEQDRVALERMVRTRLTARPEWSSFWAVDIAALAPIDRQFLVERQLISRELADGAGARSAIIGAGETCSVMINEEDHLRIQVMHSGFDLTPAWEEANRVDDLIETQVRYAYHDRLGYLTACPTNVGTGMRVSVMLHLPGLVLTREIDKAFRGLQKMSLAVRGLYGEGSQAMGDFYQISNQVTLGRSEEQLIAQVRDIVPSLIEYERLARRSLLDQSGRELHDRVSRAYGILCTAQTISSEETMDLLSSVRMGVNLGLLPDVEIPTINRLFIQTQPAHLQKLRGQTLGTADRNEARARYLQQELRRPRGADEPESN